MTTPIKSQLHTILPISLVLGLLINLSACGFYLKGYAPNPSFDNSTLKQLEISGKLAYSPIATTIREQAELSEIQVAVFAAGELASPQALPTPADESKLDGEENGVDQPLPDTSSSTKAKIVRVILLKEVQNNKRLSTSQGSDVEQHQLRLSLKWELKVGEQTLLPKPLKASAQYDYYSENALSNAQERQRVLQELRQQIASNLLRQTIAIANNPPECNCSHETQAGTTE